MTSKDYRITTYKSISKQRKWETLALIYLVFMLLISAIKSFSFKFNNFFIISSVVASLVTFIIVGPFNLSLAKISLDVVYENPTKIDHLFEGFKDFARAVLAHIINSVFIVLWSLLLIIPGIIKSISYSMTVFIIVEKKSIEPNEARKKSMQMMEGHKWDYFCLIVSFIGWVILCFLTAGILTFWIGPYMNATKALFYDSIKEKEKKPLFDADYDFDLTEY